MEDDLNIFSKRKTTLIFLLKEDDINFLKMVDNLKKIMQPKTIKTKNNDCGTAPGNYMILSLSIVAFDCLVSCNI